MAIGTGFKQQCPSCEAMVSVKDIGMVGKKVECPKCKDKFIVKSPPKKKTEDDEDEDEEEAPKPKTTAKAVPGKPVPSASQTKARPAPKKQEDDEEDDEEGDGKKKKKKAGISRFTIGIALAVVGLLVLSTAAYFILFNKGTASKGSGPIVTKTGSKGTNPSKNRPPDPDPNENKETKEPTKEVPEVRKQIEETQAANIGELTNLLPNDADHVAHVPFQVLLTSPLQFQDAVFNTQEGLKDGLLKEKLGFSILAIDHLFRADRYGQAGWSFTIVHFQTPIEPEAVKKALGLKPAPIINKHMHYQVTAVNPWFEQLARLAIGVPRPLRALAKQDRALFVHFHDSHTILFADEAPMVALLKADKHFKSSSGAANPAIASTANPAGDNSKQDPWGTIKPALKAMMEKMEATPPDARSISLFFASATDMEAAQAAGDKGRSLWYPKEIWDVTLLLQDRNPRTRALGVALFAKDDGVIRYRNEFLCPLDGDARSLETDLNQECAPTVARFIERVLAHKVAIPTPSTALPPNPAVPPTPIDPLKAKNEPASKITIKQKDKMADFTLDLKFDASDSAKLHGIASLMACGLRGEMEAAAGVFTRHDLAQAAKTLAEKGLTERNVLPGNYPPGAFLPSAGPAQRFLREPMQRVSWMAGLLPFLGQETLYGKINFRDSWRSPSNWVPAATLVSQFLDPSYPASSYYVTGLGLPLEPAATHFVGIAGVELDAADYDPADPANANKRGVMGYDQGMSLEEISKGHGLGNTIVMIQVPPDSLTGVTAWMAGGGSTLRGVPNKNSVDPFVFSSKDSSGNARRGTYALMADNSVRFIDQSVADEVFKAMATAKSPLPEDFAPDSLDSKTPKVIETKGFGAKLPLNPNHPNQKK